MAVWKKVGQNKIAMSSNRTILIGVSLVAVVCAGFYLSNNNDLETVVDGGQAASSSASAATTSAITDCAFDTTELPEHVRAIINEVAWMGDATSSNHEWIELKNISSSTVSIGGWELVDASGKVKIVFRSGARIPAGGFYLLERGGSDFLLGVRADMFFVGILKNGGDSFRLFDKYCSLIDQVIAASKWPAGDNATKKTMERDSKTLGWYTSKEIGGTPKAENGAVFVTPVLIKKLNKAK